MKTPVQSLKPQLLEMVAAGLEAAATPFAPQAIKDKLLEMAKLGVAEFRISPLLALDVTNTAVAKAGKAYLVKEKIDAHWAPAAALPDGTNNPGRVAGEFYEMVIRIKA